ncbi:unnamed protein product, partial [Polarella glacialis]
HAIVVWLLGLASPWAGVSTSQEEGEPCWDTCERFGHYCPEFCCEPRDGIGNPSCWDDTGYFGYEKCCSKLPAHEEPLEPPVITIGNVSLPLYRGPSDHNSPKATERTIEVALGLWFLRRAISESRLGSGELPLE